MGDSWLEGCEMLHWQDASRAMNAVMANSAAADGREKALDELVEVMGAPVNFERNAEVYGEGEPAEYLYKLVSGAVRVSKLMSDGRRQIGAFCLPGDFFGMEADDEHHFSAEAVADSIILVVKRSGFIAKAAHDPRMVDALLLGAVAQLQRTQDHMLLLGRKNAQERLASFLLEMAARLSHNAAVELPMSRQDIADYLGITIETVSRTLAQLERDGVISMPISRRILLRDRAALDEMNDCVAA
jgi:CRP/FNR family nitrogen fixation transcriptional regulator